MIKIIAHIVFVYSFFISGLLYTSSASAVSTSKKCKFVTYEGLTEYSRDYFVASGHEHVVRKYHVVDNSNVTEVVDTELYNHSDHPLKLAISNFFLAMRASKNLDFDLLEGIAIPKYTMRYQKALRAKEYKFQNYKILNVNQIESHKIRPLDTTGFVKAQLEIPQNRAERILSPLSKETFKLPLIELSRITRTIIGGGYLAETTKGIPVIAIPIVDILADKIKKLLLLQSLGALSSKIGLSKASLQLLDDKPFIGSIRTKLGSLDPSLNDGYLIQEIKALRAINTDSIVILFDTNSYHSNNFSDFHGSDFSLINSVGNIQPIYIEFTNSSSEKEFNPMLLGLEFELLNKDELEYSKKTLDKHPGLYKNLQVPERDIQIITQLFLHLVKLKSSNFSFFKTEANLLKYSKKASDNNEFSGLQWYFDESTSRLVYDIPQKIKLYSSYSDFTTLIQDNYNSPEIDPFALNGRATAELIRFLSVLHPGVIHHLYTQFIERNKFSEWWNLVMAMEQVQKIRFRQKLKHPLNTDSLGHAINMNNFYQQGLKERLSSGHFFSENLLSGHFDKHKNEFSPPLKSKEEYLAMANEFLKSNPSEKQELSIRIIKRPNGDLIKFDAWTKEIAVVDADGNIRTYFILNQENINDYLAKNYMRNTERDR